LVGNLSGDGFCAGVNVTRVAHNQPGSWVVIQDTDFMSTNECINASVASVEVKKTL
jgi:hypothetical protein